MTLISAIEMGLCCGLDTIDETYAQLYNHSDIFPHDKFDAEMKELDDDRLVNGINMYETLENTIEMLHLERYYKNSEEELYGCPSLRRKIDG